MPDKIFLGLFDVQTFLTHNGISYSESGKNIQDGWIGTKCLWCDDHSSHLGINLSSMGINCWRCSTSGTVIKLVMKILNVDYGTACTVIKQYSSSTGQNRKIRPGVSTPSKSIDYEALRQSDIDLMARFKFTKDLKNFHREFLESRRYDPDQVIDKYDLYSAGPVGNFARRIIIPIHYHGKIISFVGRTARNDAPLAYKNCPDKEGIIPIKETLYGLDTCKKQTILVVEGIFDKWRVGNDTVATLGTKFTDEQINLLRGFRRVFLLFDSDKAGQRAVKSLSTKLAIFTEVIILQLEAGDPDDLSNDDVFHLRRQVFQKIL